MSYFSLLPLFRRLAHASARTKLLVMICGDAVFLPLCMLASTAMRLGSLQAAFTTAPLVQILMALAVLPVLALTGLYSAVVRYIDLRVLASASAALAVTVLVVYVGAVAMHLDYLPLSALLVFWFVAFCYVVTSRFVARTLLRRGLKAAARPRQRTAIYGAGEAGVQLAQAMQVSLEYKAVCFVDDKRALRGKNIAGLHVYGPGELDEAVIRHDVAQIVVAIPSANAVQKRQLIERIGAVGMPVKILPGLVAMVDARSAMAEIREVDVVDLLGRDAVLPAPELFARNITDKVVLVTGAGGSIGAELCRQILSQRPARLVLVDHSEFALYAIDQELRSLRREELPLVAVLGSVLDEKLLGDLMIHEGVQTVYHAAAYKHVPIVEANIRQGIVNNVFGTLNVMRAARNARVKSCVLISTDKAVRPTNVMGATKRIAELIFQAAALRPSRTVFSMVRFGNVLGSSGSVVPLFRRQIQTGGPITITDTEIIRYFMLIPEAAQLVIQAGAMARGGEVFVLDMGEPVRIADLARSMIRLSGLTERTEENPQGDIEIRAVGLRPGEKLYEELLIGDDVVPSGHPRIMSAHERHVDPALLEKMLESLRQACASDDTALMLRLVRNLVPEYTPAASAGTDMRAVPRHVLPPAAASAPQDEYEDTRPLSQF